MVEWKNASMTNFHAYGKNVFNPNTDPKKKRIVTLQVTITPNDRRDDCDFKVRVTSKLAPYADLSQTVMLELQGDGTVKATERTEQIPGQIDYEGNEQPMPKVLSFGS